MKGIIKLCGILAVALSLSLFGIAKEYGKRMYIKRLKALAAALALSDDLLCSGLQNSGDILKRAFKDVEGFGFSGGGAHIGGAAFKPEIKEELNTFFLQFGSGDTALERRRIKRVAAWVLTHTEKEESDYAKTAGIWRTAGVCAGLAAGIMLL